SRFKLLEGSGGLGRDWSDNIEHSGDGFAKIRYWFAGEELAGISASRCFGSFSEVNRNLTQKSERDHAGSGIAIKLGISIDLDIDPNLIARRLLGRGIRIWVRRAQGPCDLQGALTFFLRNRRIQFRNLPDLAAGQ